MAWSWKAGGWNPANRMAKIELIPIFQYDFTRFMIPYYAVTALKKSLFLVSCFGSALITVACGHQGVVKPDMEDAKFWQRNYYDRIVRNERGLTAIRDYIRANPDRWDHDPDNIRNVDGLPAPESIDDYMIDVQR